MAIQIDRHIDLSRAQVHNHLPRIFDLLPFQSADQVRYVAQLLFDKIGRQVESDHCVYKNIDHVPIDLSELKIDEKMHQSLDRVLI